jgi:ATP-dependent DNA ligase
MLQDQRTVARRFRSIAAAVTRLPATSAILDAELVACDAKGAPNFYTMMRGAPHGCCAYCFDLMELDGRSLVVAPLEERRHLLRKLLKRANLDVLRLSEVFDDPHALLSSCERHGARRHRLEAARRPVPDRFEERLDQGQDGSLASRKPGTIQAV